MEALESMENLRAGGTGNVKEEKLPSESPCKQLLRKRPFSVDETAYIQEHFSENVEERHTPSLAQCKTFLELSGLDRSAKNIQNKIKNLIKVSVICYLYRYNFHPVFLSSLYKASQRYSACTHKCRNQIAPRKFFLLSIKCTEASTTYQNFALLYRMKYAGLIELTNEISRKFPRTFVYALLMNH